MWKFLTSLIWGNNECLSLDEAFQILDEKTEEKVPEPDSPVQDMISVDKDYVTLGKTGYITSVNDEDFIIDNTYEFQSDNPRLQVGSKVSFNIFLSGNCRNVANVTLVENDWDVSQNKMAKWCFRTIICKVNERDGRKLSLNPGEIKVDLNVVASEFVPIIGDWVQLEAKCEVDEDVVDLNGKILEIVKILPLRPHIQICYVSMWDTDKQTGILNNSIYFTRDALHGGYLPVRNDKVVAEVIESDQGRCAMRALKVVPEFLKSKGDQFKGFKENEGESKVEGIHIRKPNCLNFERLKETCQFSVFVHNELNENLKVTKVQFPKLNSQCKVISNVVNASIPCNENLEIVCECTCLHMGNSKEYLVLSTETFEVGEWIDVLAKPKTLQMQGNYQKKYSSYRQREKIDIIAGEKSSNSPRFKSYKLPRYDVPTRLLDICTKNQNVPNDVLFNELAIMKPCLHADLTLQNYLDKFHTLLYVEEINHVISMSAYDQDQAIFIRNNEFLMLEIENLSERRPSIMSGDKIYARDPTKQSKTACEWEGCVHKVGAKHVYIKFASVFHDSYNNEDYEIHVVSSRGTMRRLHSAVDFAVTNLGNEILFPTKVLEKEPQIKFECSENTDSKPTKIRGRKDILAKLKSIKTADNERISNGVSNNKHVIRLDWYNKKLNSYQKEAVKNVLIAKARPLPYIIFGPPGTGKTVTLVECILQILRLIPSSRLLVTSPSNSAADLIAFRLIESNVLRPGDLVRYISYSHSANLPPALAPFSAISTQAGLEGTISESSRVLDNGLKLGFSSAVAGRHRITVSTCSTAGTLRAMGYPKGHFSHIFIDEAGQAMEPEILIPLTFLDKSSGQAILAGDPMQLGPVIMSAIANESGLSESYVERMINRFPYVRDSEGFPNTGGYDPRLVTKLLCNYRSLPSLLKLTSSLFYNDDLIPMISDEVEDNEEVKILEKLRTILPRNEKTGKLPNIVFHAIDGESFQTPDSPSWLNPSEASQVFYYISELYRLGLTAEDIGVISPYVKQVKEIRSVLNEAELELPRMGSIEEFQGQEFNVVILSTVRSQQEYVTFDIRHSLGFISNARRLNVAISRAKILLIIIGNPKVLYQDKCWQSVINYTIENGALLGSIQD